MSNIETIITNPSEVARLQKLTTQKTCRWCEASLEGQHFKCYGPHDGGWTVKGFPYKVWIYITCPKCKYDWSICKLGVLRE